MKPATEAQKRATLKYDKENTRQYHLKLNLKSDADIIAKLDQQKSMQGYIKALITLDIKKNILESEKV